MNVRSVVAIICGAAYLWFLYWMKGETERFNKAMLNRLSDYSSEQFPEVSLPGTEDFNDKVPEEFTIKGLEDE